MTANGQVEWRPDTAEELRAIIEGNLQGDRLGILPVGAGSSLPPLPECGKLHTSGLQRVIDYPHRDMTITVEAGLRLSQLAEILSEHGQRLPIEVPHPEKTSIGGAIACNVSGPGRFGHGTLRDYVIGMTAIDGRGRKFSAGGRVVKNVAGYDLCKLMIGSEGTLAVLTQVTLKVKPIPATRSLVLASFPDWILLEPVLEMLNTSRTRPIVLNVLNPAASGSGTYLLLVGFEGSAAETRWQTETLTGELKTSAAKNVQILTGDDVTPRWAELIRFSSSRPDHHILGASLIPSEAARFLSVVESYPVQLHAGLGNFSIRLPRTNASLSEIQALRQKVEAEEGSLTVHNPQPGWSLTDRLGPLPASWRIVQQIKAVLDPAGRLSPGWFDT